MKTCRKCGKSKELFEFSKNSRRNKYDGLDTDCKQCKNEYEKKRVMNKTPVEFNICTSCKIEKHAREFHQNKGKDKGIESTCKICRNIKIVEKRYNIKEGELVRMKENISNKCEICNKNLPLAIDHSHHDGRIRGLLCTNCNNGIGRFFDNIDFLKNAIKYLMEKK